MADGSRMGIVITALFTLSIGLRIWFDTLQTATNLRSLWTEQDSSVQSLLQARSGCCGFENPSLFIRDETCPSASVAAQLGPCVQNFASFDNQFADLIFTTLFGFCAIYLLLLMLATLCLIKGRSERERYRKIDLKLAGVQEL